MFNRLLKLVKLARASESNLIVFVWKNLRYYINGLNLIAHDRAEIKNISNIYTNGAVLIGVDYFGFSLKYDRSFLNIRGKLIFDGNFSIGKGCRFDVGPFANVEIGGNGYVSPNTLFLISHGLTIGKGCMISWGCQFLDDDFHTITYDNQRNNSNNKIEIGDDVWIGCNTFIYKGVKIPSGCVIASNSVVKSSIFEINSLIAGNPAKVIKTNISWR